MIMPHLYNTILTATQLQRMQDDPAPGIVCGCAPSPLYKDGGKASPYTRSSNPASCSDVTNSLTLSTSSSNGSQQLAQAGVAGAGAAPRKRANSRNGSNDVTSESNATGSAATGASGGPPRSGQLVNDLASPKAGAASTPQPASSTVPSAQAAPNPQPKMVSAFATASAQRLLAGALPAEQSPTPAPAPAPVATTNQGQVSTTASSTTNAGASNHSQAGPVASSTAGTNTASSILSMIINRASFRWGTAEPAASALCPAAKA